MDEQRRYDEGSEPPRYSGPSFYDPGLYQRPDGEYRPPAEAGGATAYPGRDGSPAALTAGAVPEPPDDPPAVPPRSALDAIRVPLRPAEHPPSRPKAVTGPGPATTGGTPVPLPRDSAGFGPSTVPEPVRPTLDPVRPDSSQSGPSRSDPIRSDLLRPDPSRPDPSQSGWTRSDAIRPDPMRTEPIRADAGRHDPQRAARSGRHDASAFIPGLPTPDGPDLDRHSADRYTTDRYSADWHAADPNRGDRQPGDRQPGDRHAGDRHQGDWTSRRGGDVVYRTRRPVSAVVFTVATALLLVPVVRLLVDAGFAAEPGARGIVPAVLMTLGLPLTGAGLYGVAGAGGVVDRQVFLRAPAGYLPVGLVLLVAAGLAVA